MNKKDKKLVRFQDWFNPYDSQHIEWARQYLTDNSFDWENVIPEYPDFKVYPLGSCYGIREHVLNSFATCWITWRLLGINEAPVTQ